MGVSTHELTPWLTWHSIIWPWISECNGYMQTVLRSYYRAL